jgi:hypothetical protein
MDPVQTIIDIIIADTRAESDESKRALEDWYFRGGYKPKLSQVVALADKYPLNRPEELIRYALHLGAIDDLPKPAEIEAEEAELGKAGLASLVAMDHDQEEDSYSTAEIMEGLLDSDNTEERMLGDIISAVVSNCGEGEEDCAARNALVRVRDACIDALKEMSKRGYDTSEEV